MGLILPYLLTISTKQRNDLSKVTHNSKLVIIGFKTKKIWPIRFLYYNMNDDPLLKFNLTLFVDDSVWTKKWYSKTTRDQNCTLTHIYHFYFTFISSFLGSKRLSSNSHLTHLTLDSLKRRQDLDLTDERVMHNLARTASMRGVNKQKESVHIFLPLKGKLTFTYYICGHGPLIYPFIVLFFPL